MIDLDAEGFPLRGGRVDTVAGAPTAALVYRRHLHLMNVFVWPADQARAPQRSPQCGFNVLHWSDGAMQVWAVSDVEWGELDRFAQAWRAAESSQARVGDR